MYSHKYDQLIFNKGAKHFKGERTVFPTNGIGTTERPYHKNDPWPNLHTLYKN